MGFGVDRLVRKTTAVQGSEQRLEPLGVLVQNADRPGHVVLAEVQYLTRNCSLSPKRAGRAAYSSAARACTAGRRRRVPYASARAILALTSAALPIDVSTWSHSAPTD